MFEPIWKRTLQDRINNEGSPVFEITISDIAASGSMFYGMEHRDGIMTYLPMNFLRILNKGGTTLKIYLNDDTNGEIILNDTIYTHYGNVWTFKLVNVSSTAAATGAAIYTTVQHKPLGAAQ